LPAAIVGREVPVHQQVHEVALAVTPVDEQVLAEKHGGEHPQAIQPVSGEVPVQVISVRALGYELGPEVVLVAEHTACILLALSAGRSSGEQIMTRLEAIMLWLIISALGTAAAAEESSAVDAVMAQEQAWVDALLAEDLETVGALLHPTFRLLRVYADSPPIDKAEYLGMPGMRASSIKINSAEIEVIDEVAVAQVSMTLDWEQEGVGKLPPDFKLTDIWLKNDAGTWQVVSRVSQLADAPSTAGK
jgi:ketosteroid isomerase-like protein